MQQRGLIHELTSHYLFFIYHPEQFDVLTAWLDHQLPGLKPSVRFPGFATFKSSKGEPFNLSHLAQQWNHLPMPAFRWGLGGTSAPLRAGDDWSRWEQYLELLHGHYPRIGQVQVTCHHRTAEHQELEQLKQQILSWGQHKNLAFNQPLKAGVAALELYLQPKGVLSGLSQHGSPIPWSGMLDFNHFGEPLTSRDRDSKPLSRAYFKAKELNEILAPDLLIGRGEKVLELGAFPGGMCQYWSEQGMGVCAVDAARITDSNLIEQIHIIAASVQSLRPAEIPFSIDWLVSDLNLPAYQVVELITPILDWPQLSQLKGLWVHFKWQEAKDLLTLQVLGEKLLKKMPTGHNGVWKLNWSKLQSQGRELAMVIQQ